MKVVKKILADKSGMTLIELIMGMVITTLLMAVIINNLSTSIIAWQAGKNRSEIESTARLAIDSIVREIRYANNLQLDSKSSLTITKKNPATNKIQEKITFRYGSSEAKAIYKITDKTPSGGGIGTNPLTPAVIRNLEFEYDPAVDRNEVAILIQATDYKGEVLEYRSTIRCLNVLESE
jgi:type II secretory pathway pseudopilin PulG